MGKKYIAPNGHRILLDCIEDGVRVAAEVNGLSPELVGEVVDRSSTEIMALIGEKFYLDADERDWSLSCTTDTAAVRSDVIKLRREVKDLRIEIRAKLR